ncbi:lysophospholipase L1-like esterase [Stenotrophomonas maltophilia]|uniref:SGNH/GDSL hydrolase family protein n=1 Tax=Stenotrophomonas chelatiphaga TaxID=517011 RepID=UPI000F4D1B7F|nr:SGNH/GDSL hydrolase family protein [Stenotrophomonas chelatiphaga]MCS4229579.1 lysophospholipase L1-like esterase [Stenotrophomonas chelatiphaga]ROQ36821.1 lysophospholipase L1-like esterase [Stenotrophomonas maltophilia]
MISTTRSNVTSSRGIAIAFLLAFSSQAAAAIPVDGSTSQILIEEYGDSTTVGYTKMPTETIVAAINQPNTLQQLLSNEFGARVVVKNEGVGGIQSSDALAGTDGVHQSWETVMRNSTAQIVSLNFALNDAFFFSQPVAGKPSVSPQGYKAAMAELISIARKYGKEVVLYEPNPSCHPAREPILAYYVMHLDELAAEQNVPLVSQYWEIVSSPNWQSRLSDCTHPRPELYRAKGENAYQVVRHLVKRLVSK